MPITTFYLEMRSAAVQTPMDLPTGTIVLRADPPTVSYYRFLYDAVGRDWNWTSRKALSDEEIVHIIRDPRVEVLVLYVSGAPAGFAELDRRVVGEVELKQFGLCPEFIGKGLGPRFLRQVLESAWRDGPQRVWLHTCTQDHPGALAVYQRAGFELYAQETKND